MFFYLKFFQIWDVPTRIPGHPGHSLSKTTEKGHLHKVFVRDIPMPGSLMSQISRPKTLCLDCFSIPDYLSAMPFGQMVCQCLRSPCVANPYAPYRGQNPCAERSPCRCPYNFVRKLWPNPSETDFYQKSFRNPNPYWSW